MVLMLNAINQRRHSIPLFTHLTYPDEFPRDPRIWKKHLERLRSRLVRRYGQVPIVWRLEFQVRKSGNNAGQVAPHFHLLMFGGLDRADVIEWISDAWYEIVGSGDRRHFWAGTRVEELRSWRGGIGYAAKYVAKVEELQAGYEEVGRVWGIWYKHLLEIAFDEYPGVMVRDGYQIRRILARAAGISLKRYAYSPTFTVLVSDQIVIRLLKYYGYYRRP